MSPQAYAVRYLQFAAMTRAGIPLPEAVRRTRGDDLEALAAKLDAGENPRLLWRSQKWIPPADAAVLAAGQLSGKFPEACESLAARHTQLAELRKEMFHACLQPAATFSVMLLLWAFIGAIPTGDEPSRGAAALIGGGLMKGVVLLTLFWASVGAGYYSFMNNPRTKELVRALPLWGAAMRQNALSLFAGTLEAALSAGLGMAEAWTLSGDASGDPEIARAATGVARGVERDRTPPGPQLAKTGAFPENFVSLYLAGEVSGQLEQQLATLRDMHAAEAKSKARLAMNATTRLISAVVMIIVAAKIILFFISYYGGITKSAI